MSVPSVPLLQFTRVTRRFAGVPALREIDFDVRPGEVHAIVGENGAGKSTLLNLIAGVLAPDEGTITIEGTSVRLTDPQAARRCGIAICHQEPDIFEDLSLAESIALSRGLPTRAGSVDWPQIWQQARRIIEHLGESLDPRQPARDLSVAQRQVVQLATALSLNPKLLLLDEPTSSLSARESEWLFTQLAERQRLGTGVIYISHRLEEIKRICNRITIMRDGHYINTVDAQDVSIDQIISMMVGRTIYESAPEVPDRPNQETVLAVKGLNRAGVLKDINFTLKKGEILGFAGLMGAGRTEVARAVFGADRIDTGEIYVQGRRAQIKTPRDAVRYGIGYLSEDRKRYGLALGMDVESNVVLAAFKKFLGRLGWVNRGKTRRTAQQYVETLAIKTPTIQQRVRNLSGGNQQKVVIGKWLTADTDILIFDEPTRGIDVGAKSEIYKLLNDLAHQGKSIIMISSELPEVLRMSHRIIVMCEGRITGELSAAEATQEGIMKYATQRGGIVSTN